MCGIAGWFNSPRNSMLIENMLKTIKHRGPEKAEIYSEELICLGNTRLAFVDLEMGQQPLSNENCTIWITCNGEIYNHDDLRGHLISRGHSFRTRSDIEVVLHLYEEYGVKGFEELNGQYAFALWDSNKKQFILCRDRLGICPLYYVCVDGAIYFASEIKALLPIPGFDAGINLLALEAIWTLWSPLPGSTLFKGVNEVLPAQYGVFNSEHPNVFHFCTYWNFQPVRKTHTYQEALDELSELLNDAVKIRLKADVPVAAYLSGGVDSSVICSIAKKYASELHTFSITFNNSQFDESEHQNLVAKYIGSKHHITNCSAEDLALNLVKMVWHTEVPQLRAGPISMMLLSRSVQQQDIKAVLTGEGGDEFFIGYDLFKETAIRRFIARDPTSKIRPLLTARIYSYLSERKNLRGLNLLLQDNLEKQDPFFSHLSRWKNTSHLQAYLLPEIRCHFEVDHLKDYLLKLLPKEFVTWNWLEKAQAIEILTFLSPYLLASQGDRVAMAHSVEGRFPFLDHRVIEYANSLAISYKLKSMKQDKWILRQLATKYVPEYIAFRPKYPYRAPIQEIFTITQNNEFIDELLSKESLSSVGVFMINPVEKLLKKAKSEKPLSEMEQMALIGITTTQIWHRLFVQNSYS